MCGSLFFGIVELVTKFVKLKGYVKGCDIGDEMWRASCMLNCFGCLWFVVRLYECFRAFMGCVCS